MTDLFDILTFVDGQPGDGAGEGRGFDTADVPENGQKFVSRMREFLPLFEVWVRDVVAKPAKKTSGARTTAKVYDIPITQVLDFMLKSRSNMEEIFANPGGTVVAKEEGLDRRLAGEYLFPLPTRPARNARRNNMHGTLVQRMPQHNFDGFLAQARTKVYIGDVVMCDLREEGSPEPLQMPCRITATFFVQESRRLVVTVRLFRDAHEVLGVAHDDAAFVQDGVVRVWEEVGDASETDIREITQVLDRVEVFTRAELRDGAHLRPWIGAGSRREGWSFVGEGFVTRRGHRFVKRRDPFKEGGWRRAGSEEENYPDMRSADVIHNDLNLKFINLPIGNSADDFNAFGMATPYSEGAGYWQLLTLDRRLLRRKRWLHATTTAEPGACYDGAMAFAAGVLRELEKGCYTKIVEPSGGVRGESCECTVFARGGMVSKTADTPERQGSLGFKGVSQRTSHPCSLCKVKQTADADDVGGQLGERDYDVVKNRRTRRECEHGRSKLLEMGFGTGEAVKLSKELGIVEPHPTLVGHPRALWDLTSMHSPMVCVGSELLHLNNLNHLGQSQTFLLDLLSPAGREHVAGIFRQGRTLLGAGVSPLKNPVKDYPGYTGAQKALFGSVQLIVLRGLLLSTAMMKHYLNSTALKKYNGEIWGHVSPEEVRDRVLEYFQASSSLSFAANGQEFTDFDLLQLSTRAPRGGRTRPSSYSSGNITWLKYVHLAIVVCSTAWLTFLFVHASFSPLGVICPDYISCLPSKHQFIVFSHKKEHRNTAAPTACLRNRAEFLGFLEPI